MLFKSDETVPYQPKSLKHQKLRPTTESKMQNHTSFQMQQPELASTLKLNPTL